jgi:hypothetical protein
MATHAEVARWIRGHHRAVLRADDQGRRIRYVVDRATGAIVAPLRHAELEADELVLHVPDEADDGAHLLLAPTEIPESSATDHWLAYHGSPDAPVWCAMSVELARLAGDLLDEPVELANPLGRDEPALCRRFNADPASLSALCSARGVSDPSPVLVGLDPDGFDVRARTGLVRFEFDRLTLNADAARAGVELAIEHAGDRS